MCFIKQISLFEMTEFIWCNSSHSLLQQTAVQLGVMSTHRLNCDSHAVRCEFWIVLQEVKDIWIQISVGNFIKKEGTRECLASSIPNCLTSVLNSASGISNYAYMEYVFLYSLAASLRTFYLENGECPIKTVHALTLSI